jgi:hypothetical protein
MPSFRHPPPTELWVGITDAVDVKSKGGCKLAIRISDFERRKAEGEGRRAGEWVYSFFYHQENRVPPMDTTWFGKSFVRVVQELAVKIVGQCFFSILHAKLQASTTNRTLGGDHGCGRYERGQGIGMKNPASSQGR